MMQRWEKIKKQAGINIQITQNENIKIFKAFNSN